MKSKYLAVLSFVLLAFSLAACANKPVVAYSGHGATSVDEKTIAKFAPPHLEPETARFVQNILEVQSPGLGALGQDGKSMFFSWTITGVQQVWRLDGPLQFPVQMTSGSDRTGIADVTPDGKYLVLSRDSAGEENPGLYLQSVLGGPLREIFRKKGVRTSFAFTSVDSGTIFYFANDIHPDSMAFYAYSVETGKRELLLSEPGIWFAADATSDNYFLLGRQTGARTVEYFTWSLTERQLKPVIGQGEKEEYDARFAPGANEFFILTPKFGEFSRLYKLKGGKFEAITPEVKKDIESIDIDQGRRGLFISWNDQGKSRIEVLDAHTLKPVAFPEFKDAEQLYTGRISRFGRYVTLGVDYANRPRVSYVYDFKDRKLTQWTRPSAPEVDVEKFTRSALESYPARDGTLIPMLVSRPKQCAAEPCPVIVHFHGGPEGQSRPGFRRLAQIYNSSGFIYVEPNVRGSSGYGKTWFHADDGAKRLEVITDIEDCALYIRKAWAKAGREPKLGVLGWSYGGYSALMAMSRFAGAYDAGVAHVGMSNLRSFLLNTAPYRRILRISEYGDPERDREALEKLSPTSYLDRVKGPLLIVQGVSDPRVPVGEAVQMHELLEKRGIQSPLVLFANEGHGSGQRDNQVIEVGLGLEFFRQHLDHRPGLAP